MVIASIIIVIITYSDIVRRAHDHHGVGSIGHGWHLCHSLPAYRHEDHRCEDQYGEESQHLCVPMIQGNLILKLPRRLLAKLIEDRSGTLIQINVSSVANWELGLFSGTERLISRVQH